MHADSTHFTAVMQRQKGEATLHVPKDGHDSGTCPLAHFTAETQSHEGRPRLCPQRNTGHVLSGMLYGCRVLGARLGANAASG